MALFISGVVIFGIFILAMYVCYALGLFKSFDDIAEEEKKKREEGARSSNGDNGYK